MKRCRQNRQGGGARRTAGAGPSTRFAKPGRPGGPRRAGRRVRSSDETGGITVFVALMAVALFALAGLVLDGGRAMSAQQAAQDEAEQAARSGAAALSVSALRTGAVRLDPQTAVADAVAYTVAAGHPGTATVVGNGVEVHIQYRVPTDILGMVGIGTLPVSASARAIDVHGVTKEE